MRSAVAILSVTAWLLPASGTRAEVPLGAPPAYTVRQATLVPNAQAITQRIWIPGIDDGFVPQGMLFLDGKLFISSYRSVDRDQNRGPCRLFALNANSGEVLGHLNLPNACGHAGGLAEGRFGHAIVADTRAIFEIELARGEGTMIGRVVRTVRLAGAVKGSFAASTADGLWLGGYERADGARLFKFSWSVLDKPQISDADAISAVPLPAFAQGAAFDPAGRLWIMRSGSEFGELVRIDQASGAVEARFKMPAGAEGISFETDGMLWTLSEAGSRRWNNWSAFYPLAFRFDIELLK